MSLIIICLKFINSDICQDVLNLFACVASVPVRAEQNNRAARTSITFRTHGKMGREQKGRAENGVKAKRARDGVGEG